MSHSYKKSVLTTVSGKEKWKITMSVFVPRHWYGISFMGLHGKQGLGDHPSLMSLCKEHSSVDLGQHGTFGCPRECRTQRLRTSLRQCFILRLLDENKAVVWVL